MSKEYSNLSLHDQVLQECEAMAKHAFASGKKVPGSLMDILETFSGRPVTELDPGVERGAVSGGTVDPVSREKSLRQLAHIHERLSGIVAPSTPGTILLMDREREKKSFWFFLGPVPLVRGLMAAAIVSLISLILISLSKDVDGTINYATESGMQLLIEELFLLSAAGVGASFSVLFKANRYIIEGTFDSKYDFSYWITFVLGLIAGMILAMLIPVEESIGELTKPTLAMLGGFSVTVVYRILNRLVVTVESLIQGDRKEMIKAEVEASKVRVEEEHSQSKLKIASNLLNLRDQLDAGGTTEAAKKKLNKVLEELVPLDLEDEELPARTPPGKSVEKKTLKD